MAPFPAKTHLTIPVRGHVFSFLIIARASNRTLSSRIIRMPRRLKRPRSTTNESTPGHEPQSEASRADHGLGVGMNAKRVRWDSPSDMQDECDSSNSDSSGLAKVVVIPATHPSYLFDYLVDLFEHIRSAVSRMWFVVSRLKISCLCQWSHRLRVLRSHQVRRICARRYPRGQPL